MKLDPVWKEAKSECHRLETILTQMNGLVSNNGGLKRKQFEKILSKFDNSQLGPFLNASVKDPKSDRAIQLFKCTLTDLKTVSGSEEIVDFMSLLNADKVCLLKVACFPFKTFFLFGRVGYQRTGKQPKSFARIQNSI